MCRAFLSPAAGNVFSTFTDVKTKSEIEDLFCLGKRHLENYAMGAERYVNKFVILAIRLYKQHSVFGILYPCKLFYVVSDQFC